jgi:hypothetical protein
VGTEPAEVFEWLADGAGVRPFAGRHKRERHEARDAGLMIVLDV